MYQSSVPSATAGTARTALALVAIFSLLLSLFAIARPVIAFDDDEAAGPAVRPTVQSGNPDCPVGTTEIKFEGSTLAEGSQLTATILGSDGIERDVTVTITNVNVAAGTFDFEVEGGLALVVIAKGGPNGNVYDYRPLGGAAHDDGLVTPTNPNNQTPFGISHISFCVIPVIASIDVEKSGPAQSKVGDPADYTVTITNDGDVELFIQSVDDTLAGDLTAAVVEQCGSLAVDEVCIFNYSYTVQEGDDDQLVNVVTVTATTGATGTGTSVNDDGTATVDLFQPGIEVTKTADVETALVGDTVTYTVRITNTSSEDSPNLDLTVINDSLEGDMLTECPDTLAAGAFCEFTYTHVVTAEDANPLVNTVSVESNPVGFPNDIDGEATATVEIVAEEEDLGSITIIKEIDCEECETRTIGFFFNTADQHAEETNALFADLGGIMADGILFTSVDQVQQYRSDDQDGTSDGQNGLSARGQLTLQFLAASLNVERNGDECDLASRVYNNADSPFDGWTVQMILDEAELAFAGTSEYSDEEIKDALDDINNSSQSDENPLTCEGSESGTLDGVTFDLFTQADFESDPQGDPIDSQTTADGGVAFFGELTIGETYVLVESGFPEGVTCEIVGVDGGDAEVIDGVVYVTLTQDSLDENLNLTLTVENDCEEDQEEEVGSLLIAKTDEAGASLGGATFSVDGTEYADTDEDGFVCVDGLTLGDTVSVEETDAPDGYIGEEGAVDVAVLSDEDCATRLDVEDPQADADITFVNVAEEDDEGILEVDKFYCPADDDGTQFIVSAPAPLQSARIQGEDEEGVGCSVGDATFTIEKSTGEIWDNVSVGDDGQIELDLPAGSYTITETSTDEVPAPSATFTIEDGAITAVIVINFEGEDEEEGQIKIIKLFCDAEEDSVTFTIEGGNQLPPSLDNCELGDAAFQLNDGETFTIGDDGIWFASMPVGSYTLTEVVPNQATSPSFDVELGEITTIIVVNNEGEDDEDEETVEVSIMKHLCADVATVAEFEAIEAAAAEENPDNAFAPLVATVLACPTIVLTGDVPTEGAVSGGEVDFEFSVLDADGNQLLSDDGTTFMQAELCESDVMLDLDGDPEVDACLDVSHYTFEVVDGLVVITETDAPEGHRLGTIRFTPGSDDADALVGDIEDVERTGVIVLDTTADGDDSVMIHAYNFILEDEQGGGGTGPDNTDTGNTPRDGTAGGNPLPNTAILPNPTGSVPAALLALAMLSGLGAAGYAMATEARRRR